VRWGRRGTGRAGVARWRAVGVNGVFVHCGGSGRQRWRRCCVVRGVGCASSGAIVYSVGDKRPGAEKCCGAGRGGPDGEDVEHCVSGAARW